MSARAFHATLLGAAILAVAGPALAQSTAGSASAPSAASGSMPAAPVTRVAPPAVTGTPANGQRSSTTAPSAAASSNSALTPGAKSFTEAQARGRIEAAGFTAVTGLHKDDQGIWRGRATRGGVATDVAIDFQGDIATGSATMARTAQGGAASGTTATRGNAASANPPGTAAGRAVDRAGGTNINGATPGTSRPDGAPGNPPSTAFGRAVDRAQGETPRADGTPGNPPGTAVGRALGTAPTR